MSEPYVGEIRMFAGNFAPANWFFCDGSLLSITDYETLFNLIGTTYGGNGQTTFALPDLRSRVPIHQTGGYPLGLKGGAETVQLNTTQLPAHSHVPQANSGVGGNSVNSPANSVWSGWTGGQFTAQAPSLSLHPQAIATNGGGQPHDNMVPFQALSFIISPFGIYPSQN
jgi:microcystin-dependent protein